MLCRHFTNTPDTNHKQCSSALVPSQTPKQQHAEHESWSIPVGRNVHDRSWGRRATTKRAWGQNPRNGFRRSEPWTAANFSILQELGEGHFGSVFLAKLASDRTVWARSSSATSVGMELGQYVEQDVRDDMDDNDKNGSFRDDDDADTRDSKDRTSTGGTSRKYVALKRFCKSRIRQSQEDGGRALELIRREVNIHSQ
jgi:serine/threonine protein kinase